MLPLIKAQRTVVQHLANNKWQTKTTYSQWNNQQLHCMAVPLKLCWKKLIWYKFGPANQSLKTNKHKFECLTVLPQINCQKDRIFTFQNKKFQIANEETSNHLRERNMHYSTSCST